MTPLNKLIEQYERENPGETAYVNPPMNLDFSSKFTRWLASRPTCGKEQRKFLDEVEKNFEMPNTDDKTIQHKFGESLIDGYDFEDICDLQKVVKGE